MPYFQQLAGIGISPSSLATERFKNMLGKAMEVVPPARIPANKVAARRFQNDSHL
jgi:hypothetical protein